MSRILIVEDSPTNLEMLEMQLQGEGHEVLVAMDGATGVSIAFYELPDLILMDMELPLLDGWAATAALKNEAVTRNIPVIALTAHAMKAQRTRSMEAGCAAYVNKPIDFEYLLQKMESVMASAPPRGAAPASVVRAMWLARSRESSGQDAETAKALGAARAEAEAAHRAEAAAAEQARAESEARLRAEAQLAALAAQAPTGSAATTRAQAKARRSVLQRKLDAANAAAQAAAQERAALQAELQAAKARLEELSFFNGLPRDVAELQSSLLRSTRQLHRTRSRLLSLQAGIQGVLEASLPAWASTEPGSTPTIRDTAPPVPDLEHLDEQLQEEETAQPAPL